MLERVAILIMPGMIKIIPRAIINPVNTSSVWIIVNTMPATNISNDINIAVLAFIIMRK